MRDPGYRHGIAGNFVALSMLAAMPGAAAPATELSATRSYPVHVWRQGGPPPTEEWSQALLNLGFTGTNVEAAEPPEHLRFPGFDLYQDHLVNRVVFRRDSDDPVWVEARTRAAASAATASFYRNPSLAAPETLQQIAGTASVRAARAASAGADFISITDEPSFTNGITPFDYDWSPASIHAWRESLRLEFTTSAAVSRVFGAPIRSLDTVEPMTTIEIRAREFAHGAPWNFAPFASFRNHSDRSFALALGEAAGAAREAMAATGEPPRPVGFLGGLPPAAFGGYDWWRILDSVRPEVLEIYDAGAARDLVRALAPGVELVDTVFLSQSFSAAPPDLAPARMSWLFARGGRRAVVWSNQYLFDGASPDRPTDAARDLGARARVLRALAAITEGATREFDDLAIVYSHPSTQIGWMFDSKRDGATFAARQTSHELQHSTMLASLEGWFRICDDFCLSPRAFDARELPGMPPERLPKILIFPRALALSPKEGQAILQFIESGGTALFEGRPGLFDHDLRGGDLRGTPAHPGAAGLPFRGFADENCIISAGTARDEQGALVLEPALESVTVHRVGAGRAVFLNISFTEYRDDRLPDASSAGRARAAALRARCRGFLETAAREPNLQLLQFSESGGNIQNSALPLPFAVERLRRGDRWFFYISANVRRRPALARGPGKPVSLKIKTTGFGNAALSRLDGGEPITRNADGTFTIAVSPTHLALLALQDPPAGSGGR